MSQLLNRRQRGRSLSESLRAQEAAKRPSKIASMRPGARADASKQPRSGQRKLPFAKLAIIGAAVAAGECVAAQLSHSADSCD